VRSICNAVLAGSAERKLSGFFGLIHSNTSKTSIGVLPCKGSYLELMAEVDALNFAQEDSIDLPKALKLLKLSLKQAKALPRVVIVTSSVRAPRERGRQGRQSGLHLPEDALMEEYCDDHFGKLHSLDPFDTLSETAWQWQKELLSHLGMSHREATTTFDFKANQSRSSRPLFSFESGSSKTRSSMKMVESCRGESLDSYQHLSSDGLRTPGSPPTATWPKSTRKRAFLSTFTS